MFPASNERGSALVMVIFISLIISAVGGTMLIMSNSDHLISANERDAERALMASRAGLSYAFHLFQDGSITPSVSGTAFDSFTASVGGPLDGGEFSGQFFDLSATVGTGQLYRIVSTGSFDRGSRTTELVFQIIPQAFKYGYTAFNEATLHNHSGIAASVFKIESTVFSNNSVSLPEDITLDGSVVAGGDVSTSSGSTVKGDIFANGVDNDGTIEGDVMLVNSVRELSSSASSWDRLDIYGNKYDWWNGSSSPGSYGGGGTVVGSTGSYAVVNGDEFIYDIFTKSGSLIPDPDVNVTKYIAPPLIDYAAMKTEADLNDATYFTSTKDAVSYLISKKTVETVGGFTVTTVKVGTPSNPEFIYVADDFQITLDPNGDDDASDAEIKADGLFIEGGLYVAGDFDFDGPQYDAAKYPPPPDYYMLSINALDYCFPALLAYNEPGSGSVATWQPINTPAIGTGSKINMNGGSESFSYFNGMVFAQNDIHLHHTDDATELIRFNGAELAWKIHNCDYFWFSYDPAVRCTRFLVTDQGTPQVVSYREIR